jgi:hypothetical protein
MKKTLLLLIVAAAFAVLAWWLMRENFDAATPLTTADFAISDTSAVGKVEITTADGKTASIARGSGSEWRVNEKFPARKDAIDLILKTLHLLEIKHPVSAGSRENVIRMMAGRHSYVQVFDRNDKLIKAYYVGLMTPDQRGTYMLLERPDEGRSEIPYVMTMKTFYGYLTSRFFTDEKDWRSRTIIEYPELEINRVEVLNHVDEGRSFAVDMSNPKQLKMFNMPENTPVLSFDTLALQEYLVFYKKASCETWDLAFEPYQIDSILTRNADLEIKIQARNADENAHIRFFLRPAPEDQKMDDGSPAIYDREVIYGTTNGTELFRAQRYVWDPLLTAKQSFTSGSDF